jgi:maltooligosyltrehalose synthase
MKSVFTGETLPAGRVSVSQLLAAFPVALLMA